MDKRGKTVRELTVGTQSNKIRGYLSLKVLLASLVQMLNFKDEENDVQGDLSSWLEPDRTELEQDINLYQMKKVHVNENHPRCLTSNLAVAELLR